MSWVLVMAATLYTELAVQRGYQKKQKRREEEEPKKQGKKRMSFSSEEDCDDFHGVSFFKVIREESIADQRLMLPRKFTSQYGGFLEGKATLLDTNGLRWEMRVFKDGNERFWLQNGWGEFAEFYSLAHGDFVVFEYCTGGSYDDDDQNDESIEFSVIVFDGETEMEMEMETSSNQLMSIGVEMFMSNSNHPCFKHEVTPSYFAIKLMPIPQGFFESYLGRVDDDMMGLIKLGCGGKVWDVQVCRYGAEHKYRRFGFADWKRFSVENSVEQGDV